MFKRKKQTEGKSFPVKVCTMDAELEFSLNWKATGQELFDLVCRTIGLRETWYFGLQFHDSKGYVAWLKLGKNLVNKTENFSVYKHSVKNFDRILAEFWLHFGCIMIES